MVTDSANDDPAGCLGGAVNADVGNSVEPADELGVEVFEVAEAAAEEEVLADITEGSLYFPLRFLPGKGGNRGARSDNAAPAVTAVFMRS